jgi:hypothetical protein
MNKTSECVLKAPSILNNLLTLQYIIKKTSAMQNLHSAYHYNHAFAFIQING